MENHQGQLTAPRENIRFGKPIGRPAARFFAFLTCIAILTAAFAMSGVWLNRKNLLGFLEKTPVQEEENPPSLDLPPEDDVPEDNPKIEPTIPEGAISILSLDLSFQKNQLPILQNETSYRLNLDEIKKKQSITGTECDGPLVLILHTHASEAYLLPQVSYLIGNPGNQIYSNESDRSVVAVGEALCNTLNQNGISAVQCLDAHGKNGTLQNSYAGAAACIEEHLERYPSIQYVIDLHRDGILGENGELVRTTTNKEESDYAQIMAVVGTDGNGTECPNWQTNLALALRLNERLESRVENLCRPISLRNASYNQELVPNALLLEIGSAGNTQQEAIRSVELLGEVLAELIKEDLS